MTAYQGAQTPSQGKAGSGMTNRSSLDRHPDAWQLHGDSRIQTL